VEGRLLFRKWVNWRRGTTVKYCNYGQELNACYYDTHEAVAMRDIRAGAGITHNCDSK